MYLVPLTSPCCIYTNGYILVNNGWTHYNRYFTVVDSSHSTSPPVQTYYHPASGNVEPPFNSFSIHIISIVVTRNISSIGKEPVSYARPLGTCIRMLATSCYISYAKQSIINIANVLQVDEIIVLICCTIEWKSDTFTCTWISRDYNVTKGFLFRYQKLVKCLELDLWTILQWTTKYHTQQFQKCLNFHSRAMGSFYFTYTLISLTKEQFVPLCLLHKYLQKMSNTQTIVCTDTAPQRMRSQGAVLLSCLSIMFVGINQKPRKGP